jgi:hypothetical protein
MRPLLCAFLTALFFVTFHVSPPAGAEEVKGSLVRPGLDKAKVKGCEIAQPGDYRVEVGDVIELDYAFPVVPTAAPDKVGSRVTSNGVIEKSSLGIRSISEETARNGPVVGESKLAFFFEAKKAGEETVTLTIDGSSYEYRFKVAKKSK